MNGQEQERGSIVHRGRSRGKWEVYSVLIFVMCTLLSRQDWETTMCGVNDEGRQSAEVGGGLDGGE